jgi:Na+/citrate or Na+/malate symporter
MWAAARAEAALAERVLAWSPLVPLLDEDTARNLAVRLAHGGPFGAGIVPLRDAYALTEREAVALVQAMAEREQGNFDAFVQAVRLGMWGKGN